jgi:cleavage and polyadenylation specificity factor subunit 1
VASGTAAEHEQHLRDLLLRLRQHNLVINAEKCQFGVSGLEFLGRNISAAGAAPLPAYVEAVAVFPPPSLIKELQQFLGLLNFYRRFLPGIAATLKPLTDLLKGSPKGNDALKWAADQQLAFEAAKSALVAATRLAHPQQEWVLSLAVDASSSHIGACLQQKSPKSAVWQPLGFFFKKTGRHTSEVFGV